MSIEGFICKLKNIKPIEEWAQVDNEQCPSCTIAPLASFYLGVLERAGADEQVAELKRVYEQGDLLTICKTMDTIKGQVGEALEKELKDLDCFAQSEKFEA